MYICHLNVLVLAVPNSIVWHGHIMLHLHKAIRHLQIRWTVAKSIYFLLRRTCDTIKHQLKHSSFLHLIGKVHQPIVSPPAHIFCLCVNSLRWLGLIKRACIALICLKRECQLIGLIIFIILCSYEYNMHVSYFIKLGTMFTVGKIPPGHVQIVNKTSSFKTIGTQ